MKKSKRLLSLGIAAALTLSLAACGSSPAPGTPSTPAASTPASSAPAGPVSTDSKWYEGKTINILVPANASSQIGIMVQLMGDYLSRTYGNSWVVTCDNTGNGTVAFEQAANADPDGTTILFTQNLAFAYYGGVYDKYPLDILDPVAVGNTVLGSQFVCVPASAPYDDLEGMKAYAKEKGGLLCGIQNQANSHLMSSDFATRAELDTIFVETGGSSDKITAMLGGTVDWCMMTYISTKDYLANGDLKMICSMGAERDPALPDIPCAAELGIEPVVTTSQSFWYMPKGTDPSIEATFNQMVADMAQDEELVAGLKNMSSELDNRNMEETLTFQTEILAACKDAFAGIGVDVSAKK